MVGVQVPAARGPVEVLFQKVADLKGKGVGILMHLASDADGGL
jgi:hypothetical protein